MREGFKQALDILILIENDRSIPRNIRETASESKEIIQDTSLDEKVMIDKVVQILDEVSEDPNMPIHARTQIWNVVSLLEAQ